MASLHYSVKNVEKWLSCTLEYIASNPPEVETLSSSQNRPEKHLILDLDNCIICDVFEKPNTGLDNSDVKFFEFYSIQSRTRFRKTTRPGLYSFLKAMKSHYLIHVFTSSGDFYALDVMENIDPTKEYVKGNIFARSGVKEYRGCNYKHLHEVIFKNQFQSLPDAIAHAQKHSILFDDDPFYAMESGDTPVLGDCPVNYADNVISVIPYNHPDIEVENPVLSLYYQDLLIYLASMNDIRETMKKLKKFWFENDVIEFIIDKH